MHKVRDAASEYAPAAAAGGGGQGGAGSAKGATAPRPAWQVDTSLGKPPKSLDPLKPMRSPVRRGSMVELLEDITDGNTFVDYHGFCTVCDELSLKLNVVQKKKHFSKLDKLDGQRDGHLELAFVHGWARDQRASQLRRGRQLARKLFDLADADHSVSATPPPPPPPAHQHPKNARAPTETGARHRERLAQGYLDLKEVKDVQKRLTHRCPEVVLDPPFDDDTDFAIMDKDNQGSVSWEEFESW
jgi:hypothetical protein